MKNCFYTGGEVLLSEEHMKIIGHWVKIISKTSSHKNDYGVVTGVTKNKEWLKVRLSDSTIRIAFGSVVQIN